MERYLCSCGVLIKEFKHFAESMTAKVKAAAYRGAAAAKRPAQYLSSPKLSKEQYARQIALEDRIKEGLIVLFSAKEPCYSYSVRGDRTRKEIHLVIEPRMCTHFYWSAAQSEYATDLLFKDARSLAALYPQFLHHGISSFASPDVLRFLGQRRPTRSQGQVTSTLKQRPEGVRIRHSVNANSIKLYDKQSLILRVETTINDPKQFKVYRASEKDPEQVLKWLPLRFGVADLWRRAQVSQAANRRYLEALASTTGRTPLYQEALGVCQAIVLKGQRYRALNPWAREDGVLLEAINRGEFRLNGLRNRDLRAWLYPKTSNPKLQHRQAAAITRRLALLRAHGILQKVSGTHRYQLTKSGQRIVTALLAARHCDVDQLTKMAA
jgi:hypothetical protein